jgi:hypothetical protein
MIDDSVLQIVAAVPCIYIMGNITRVLSSLVMLYMNQNLTPIQPRYVIHESESNSIYNEVDSVYRETTSPLLSKHINRLEFILTGQSCRSILYDR